MLENWRYNRALKANKGYVDSNSRDIFLGQEYLTQLALHHLGIKDAVSPSDVLKVGNLLVAPGSVPNLRVPYAVEVLGMPHAGKSTMINQYLEELWLRGERYKVGLAEEGVRSIKQEHGDLRYSDSFLYSLLGGFSTFLNYISSLRDMSAGMRMVVSDRGQIDRRVFRRALFSRGDVNPEIMEDEALFIGSLENTPIQIGGVIMLMMRPEESIRRSERLGPVVNMDFLSLLYEQYWGLHWEIIQGEFPCRVYTCIDAERGEEEVYERFRYAMDTTSNIRGICLAALAKAFPEEFEKARAECDKDPRRPNYAQRVLSEKLGRRVLIVGGDDMESEDDILSKFILEGLYLGGGSFYHLRPRR